MAPTGSIAIGDSDFGSFSDETDDLPRTFRREKEARARAARERAAQERAAAPTLSTDPVDCVRPQPRIYDRAGDDLRDSSSASVSATVRAFEVPFVHLMTFFLRAVLASIPALLRGDDDVETACFHLRVSSSASCRDPSDQEARCAMDPRDKPKQTSYRRNAGIQPSLNES
jgi:hypothetical protein